MRGHGPCLLLVFVLALAPGCSYKVFTSGVIEPRFAPEGLDPGTKVCAAVFPSDESSPLNRGLGPKVERLLEDHGFSVVPLDEASFVVFYGYERTGLVELRRFEPISGVQTGITTRLHEGPFVHRFSVTVVDAETYRTDDEVAVVWAGGAVLARTTQSSPKLLDLLLVAAFEHFGEDTERTIKEYLALGDPRAKALRAM